MSSCFFLLLYHCHDVLAILCAVSRVHYSAYMRIGDKSLLRKSLQYFLTIFVFACGAGIGGAYSLYIGNEFIWISCALLLICFVLMFIKSENDMMREDM